MGSAPYSTIPSEPSSFPLTLAHSIANKEAFKNFLFAYFLQTYWREKFSSVSFCARRLCPGKSCSSVYPEKNTNASPCKRNQSRDVQNEDTRRNSLTRVTSMPGHRKTIKRGTHPVTTQHPPCSVHTNRSNKTRLHPQELII
jgi:hypothetical protein